MNSRIVQSAVRFAERAKLVMERRVGVPFDYFMALSNLARELAPVNFPRAVEDVWVDYRVHTYITNLYRNRPELFPGFAQVIGLRYLVELLGEGGAIVTLHYGDYRHAVRTVVEEIRRISRDVPLCIVVDSASYQTERNLPKWDRYLRGMRCELLIAESHQVGIQLFRHLRRGGWLILYLDGNTGAGADSHPT